MIYGWQEGRGLDPPVFPVPDVRESSIFAVN